MLRIGHTEKKYVISLLIFFFICSGIFVNSLNLNGYYCVKTSFDSNKLVVNSTGYNYNNDMYLYQEGEKCYIQITGGNDLEELFFEFSSISEQDIEFGVTCLATKENNNKSVKAIWKKGTSFSRVKVEKGNYVGFDVSIPENFFLNNVYYAIDNGYSGPSKLSLLMVFFCLSVILSIGLSNIKIVKGIIDRLGNNFNKYKDFIIHKKKMCFLCILNFIVCLFISMVICCIILKVKQYEFSYKAAVLCIIPILLIDIFLFFRTYFKIKIEIIGTAIVLFIGTVFAGLTPASPGVSWDDETHYVKTLQLSHIFDRNMSVSDEIMLSQFAEVALAKKYYNREEQKNYYDMLDTMDKAGYYQEIPGVARGYETIAYLPSAIGLIIGRGLSLPYHMTFIIGKWMNTLLFATLVYLSMKQLKNGKMLILLIALMPTNIFLSGNYTYDIWLTGWSMLGLSAFFGEIQRENEKINKKTIWLIAVALFVAVLPKRVYFPLTFIALFMPTSKFENRKELWKYRMMILFVAILPFITVYLERFTGNMGVGDTRGGEEVNATEQLAYMLSNPFKAAKTLTKFLISYLNPFVEGNEYVNQLAYLGYVPGRNFNIVMIILGALLSRGEKEYTKFPMWFRIGTFLVYCGIGAMAAGTMYLAFTPVAADTVAGCQGRYIIPALFPVLLVWTRWPVKLKIESYIKQEYMNAYLLFYLVIISIWGLWRDCICMY